MDTCTVRASLTNTQEFGDVKPTPDSLGEPTQNSVLNPVVTPIRGDWITDSHKFMNKCTPNGNQLIRYRSHLTIPLETWHACRNSRSVGSRTNSPISHRATVMTWGVSSFLLILKLTSHSGSFQVALTETKYLDQDSCGWINNEWSQLTDKEHHEQARQPRVCN